MVSLSCIKGDPKLREEIRDLSDYISSLLEAKDNTLQELRDLGYAKMGASALIGRTGHAQAARSDLERILPLEEQVIQRLRSIQEELDELQSQQWALWFYPHDADRVIQAIFGGPSAHH